ncbi:phosphoglycerol transferase MdoB-like AlkP superfamily enzyme [Sporosarcina luteola]|nr:phosphoglycerol transferase MdoB-like AlkP superfamily enzyme [Sporosarcina luteola]
MLYLVLPIVTIGLTASLIYSKIYKEKPKVDKGFELIYFKLSYRRKLIRTFINLPILILLFFVMFRMTDWSMIEITILILFFLITFIGTIVYNFLMWKKKEA